MAGLYYNTVNALLKESLLTLMSAFEFDRFRLVGGTALSLQLGHRSSIDIDLFSKERYEYNHNKELILRNMTDFSLADDDFDPICLRGKYWEFIKEDIKEAVVNYLRFS